MPFRKFYLLLLLFLFGNFFNDRVIPQADTIVNKTISRNEICRIMFYNVENLFDCADDPNKNDNEYLPDSKLHWTEKRFRQKLSNIFKVIATAGEEEPPEIVAFAEVENKYVLEQLIYNTPLSKYKYAIVHKDSPDERGIDVALIYRPDKIAKVSEKFFNIEYSPNTSRLTRDILYFSFRINSKEIIHLFVNHWPSRYGGQLANEKNRMFVASVLKSKTDSLFALNTSSKIIIVGDFNDEPGNNSIKTILRAVKPNPPYNDAQLINISNVEKNSVVQGTHKFHENWAIFDQVIVSGSILQKKGTYTLPDSYTILTSPFLFENDEKFLGLKPKRTYFGYKYIGGYSDHLPVFIDLFQAR